MVLTFQQLWNIANQYNPINETSVFDVDTLVAFESSPASGISSTVDPTSYWVAFEVLSTGDSNRLTLYLGVFVPMAVIGMIIAAVLILNRKAIWTRKDIEDYHRNVSKNSRPKPFTAYNFPQDDQEDTVFNYVERRN